MQGLASNKYSTIFFIWTCFHFLKADLRFSPPPFSEREQIQDIYIIFTCCIIFTCFLVPQIIQKIMLPLLLTDEELKVKVFTWTKTIVDIWIIKFLDLNIPGKSY